MDEISQKLDGYISAHDFSDVAAEFKRCDAVAAPVLSVEDILDHPQIAHRGAIAEVAGEETRVVAPVPHMEKTPGSVRWLGRSEIGAEGAEILAQIGYTPDEITGLAAQKIITLPRG